MRGAAWDNYKFSGNDYESTDIARHSVTDERFPQLLTKGRLRKRGPRSIDAQVRRSERFNSGQRQPPSDDPGKSGLESLACDTKVAVLFLNIHGYLSHQIELEAFLRNVGLPKIVGSTEFFWTHLQRALCYLVMYWFRD